jgi:hypothetical protein
MQWGMFNRWLKLLEIELLCIYKHVYINTCIYIYIYIYIYMYTYIYIYINIYRSKRIQWGMFNRWLKLLEIELLCIYKHVYINTCIYIHIYIHIYIYIYINIYRSKRIQWGMFNRWLKLLEIELLDCTAGLIDNIIMKRKKYEKLSKYLVGAGIKRVVCFFSPSFLNAMSTTEGKTFRLFLHVYICICIYMVKKKVVCF